jgi:hypothetical protein
MGEKKDPVFTSMTSTRGSFEQAIELFPESGTGFPIVFGGGGGVAGAFWIDSGGGRASWSAALRSASANAA